MNWDAGFAGGTDALIAEQELVPSPPAKWSGGYAAGKITAVQMRTFEAPVPVVGAAPLVVQVGLRSGVSHGLSNCLRSRGDRRRGLRGRGFRAGSGCR